MQQIKYRTAGPGTVRKVKAATSANALYAVLAALLAPIFVRLGIGAIGPEDIEVIVGMIVGVVAAVQALVTYVTGRVTRPDPQDQVIREELP